jgi:S1-C subfamily serine protease
VRLPNDLVRSLTLTQEIGLLVVGVDEGGPAQKSGVLLGDVLVTFDGHAVEDPGELLVALSGDRIGAQVELGVIRAGKRETLRVTVGERPTERGGPRRTRR